MSAADCDFSIVGQAYRALNRVADWHAIPDPQIIGKMEEPREPESCYDALQSLRPQAG
jgi:hypothetical protein